MCVAAANLISNDFVPPLSDRLGEFAGWIDFHDVIVGMRTFYFLVTLNKTVKLML